MQFTRFDFSFPHQFMNQEPVLRLLFFGSTWSHIHFVESAPSNIVPQVCWVYLKSYRFYSEVSELLQLVSYVQLKDTAGSGGAIFGPMKLFLSVFCRADHLAYIIVPQNNFGHGAHQHSTIAVTLWLQFFNTEDNKNHLQVDIADSCIGLKAEWTSTIETTKQFPVLSGTVVKVTCSDSGAFNKGSSEVTCKSGNVFTYVTETSCPKPGENMYIINAMQELKLVY